MGTPCDVGRDGGEGCGGIKSRAALPPLTPEQKQMVQDNYYLAVFFVNLIWENERAVGYRLQQPDLVSVACWGLIKAVIGFDASRGIKFSSYAGRIIKREIFDEIQAHARLIPLPNWLAPKNPKQYNGRPATAKALRARQRALSITLYGGFRTPGRHGVGKRYDPPAPLPYQFPDSKSVRSLLAHLSTMEREVVMDYFGFDGRKETEGNMAEIARRRGKTRERMRQILKAALAKLRPIAEVTDNV